MKGIKVATLVLKRGDSMKGRVISGPSETLYLVIGVTQYGLEVVNVEDYRNEVPDGILVPVTTHVNFATDTELARFAERLRTLRKKHNLPDPERNRSKENGRVH